ncbi:MAG: DUF5606 domain-containing protein [Mangrovibacterium sp.]
MKGILAISGQPGLSKLISEAKNCIIVESLLTGKRMPVYSTSKGQFHWPISRSLQKQEEVYLKAGF